MGCLIVSVGNLYLSSVSNYYFLVLYSIGFGLGEGFMVVSCVNIIMDCLPSKRIGSGFGIYQLCLCSTFVIGPSLSGMKRLVCTHVVYSCNLIGWVTVVNKSFYNSCV